ncbi:MAG: sterol carrier family protein, partial [Mycobacteriales bacterium]
MPRRARPSFDAVRAATLAQFRLVASHLEHVPDGEFAAPTRLGEWSVRELAAHLVGNIARVSTSLVDPLPDLELDWPTYYDDSAADAPEIDARARERGAELSPAQLRAALHTEVERAAAGLGALSASRIVATAFCRIDLAEFLISRCVEGVAHGLDLQAAVAIPATPAEICDPAALGIAVRGSAELLAKQAPGRAVEVRVPGPSGVAVQCGTGPRHTRGTPGSVVETDAVTFVELTTGRL